MNCKYNIKLEAAKASVSQSKREFMALKTVFFPHFILR
jgi:hypothetical protein